MKQIQRKLFNATWNFTRFLCRLSKSILDIVYTCHYRVKVRENCKKHDIQLNALMRTKIKSYWKSYFKRNSHIFQQYYSAISGQFDERYLPDDFYYRHLALHLNDMKYEGFTNKCFQKVLFDCLQPGTVFMKINNMYYSQNYEQISKEQVKSLIIEAENMVLRPAIGTFGGEGIIFYDKIHSGVYWDELPAIFSDNDNYIVQEIVLQHPELKKIHAKSLNTIRLTTLLLDGETKILSSVLRMGVGGSRLDNASSGGIVCGINENGQLKDFAYTWDGFRHDKHPQGYVFKGGSVPSYFKAVDMVKKLAVRMPYFRLLAWDIAINANSNPVLIEFNTIGQLDFNQYANGPLLGEYTDRILSELRIKSKC